MEVIDIDSLLESCGQSEVTVEDVKQAEGYLEIKDGHTKVIFKALIILWKVSEICSQLFGILSSCTEAGSLEFPLLSVQHV